MHAMRPSWCAALLFLASCAASPLPDAQPQVDAVAAAPAERDVDAQIVSLIQELEKLQGLTPREKRAVNALIGGGGFLNELNKGPTYSQLLSSSGSGFNKIGIFSSLLGSSSGGGAAAGGDAGATGGSDSGSILGLLTPLLGSSSGGSFSLLDLASLILPGGAGGASSADPDPVPEEDDTPDTSSVDDVVVEAADETAGKRSARALKGGLGVAKTKKAPVSDNGKKSYEDLDGDGSEQTTAVAVVGLPLDSFSSSGGGAGASAGASVSLGGGVDGGDLGASVGASIDGSEAGAGASASAGAGGSDSGSILGLVTPLLGSSSQGSAGDGSASGGNPVGAVSSRQETQAPWTGFSLQL